MSEQGVAVVVATKLTPHLAAMWLCGTALAAQQAPFAYLYDSGSPGAGGFSSQTADGRPNWHPLAEGDLAHRFEGRALLLNNKLALSVGRDGARLYGRVGSGWALRASLGPCPAAALQKLTVAENGRSAVAVDAAFLVAGGKGSSLRFRLTAGAAYAEARGGGGAGRLRVHFSGASCVAVPDLLAGDAVYARNALGQMPRQGLPAENCALAFLGEGQAIVVLTWKLPAQNADLLVATRGGAAIDALEIECGEGQSVWIASLETPGIWHSLSGAAGLSGLDRWKPPFPAKWRADLLDDDGTTRSWDLGSQPAPSLAGATQALVYPLDRSRQTPLTLFCPIDILRETLGVGPCEYILAVEGLGSAENPTPAEVTRWLGRQLRRGRAARNAGAVRERLRLMAEHVARISARIAEYEKFVAGIRALCQEKPRDASIRRLVSLVDELKRHIAAGCKAAGTPQETERLAQALLKLVVNRGSPEEVRRLCEHLRASGAAQDVTLARCRMGARRVRQWARMASPRKELTPLAREVRKRAEATLRIKGERAGRGE